MREAGADDSTVLVKEDAPTSTKTRVLAGGKNTRRQQMLRIDRDGPREPGPQLTQKLLKALASARCDAIMVSDYGLGLLSPPLVEAVRALAGQGRTVCVDARYGLAKYRGVTVAKPNEVELETAVGRAPGDDPAALEEAGRGRLKTLLEQALAAREEARSRGALCAVANGAFDLLHVGHVRYLLAAKELTRGGLLVVGINSDVSVRASKGPRRPVLPERERAEIVDAIKGVDCVVLFDEPTAGPLLEALKPDLHVK